MSVKINIFENTVISCIGSTPYTFTSNDTGHLNHVELRSSDDSEINANLTGISFTDVAFRDNSTIGETTFRWLRGSSQTIRDVNHAPLGPRTLECSSALKSEYYRECQTLVGKGYNISGVTSPLIIEDVPDIMYDYTTKTLSATVDTGQSYDLSWSISVTQEAIYNPYNIPISSIIEIVKTDATHAELRFKNTERWPWLFGIITVTLTDSVTGISTEAEIDCAVRWGPEIRGVRTIDDLSHDYVYEIWMQNLYTETYVQLTQRLMNWSIREDLTDPYLIGKMTMYNSARLWGTLRPDQSSLTTDGEYQIVINAKCPSSSYMFYPYDQDFDIWVEVDTAPQARTVTYDLNNNWMVSTYSHPSDAVGMAMFQSESNHNVSGATATMYIRYSASSSPDEVAVFICSNSEPGYDYTKIYALDSESTVATDTSSHQGTPNGLLSTNYVQQSYNIPGDNQAHFIRIDYYKDSSGNMREDRGFVCVAPMDGQVINAYTPQAPVASVDISEVVYMGGGTYEFDVEVSPVNADTSALRFDPWYTCNFVSSSMDLGQTWTDTGFGTIKTKGHVYFTGLVSNSGQFGIVLKSDNDPGIFDEEIVTVGDV